MKHNANHATVQPKQHKKWPWVLLGIFVLLVALGAALGVTGYKFYKQALQVKDHEMAAVETVKQVKDITNTMDPATLQKIIKPMQQHTSAARTIAHGGLWKLAAMVPVYGDDIRAVQGMTEVVDDLASKTLPEVSDTLTTVMSSDLSAGNGQINMQPVLDLKNAVNTANTQVQQQYKKMKNLPTPHIGLVKNAYDQALDQFADIADKLNQGNEMLSIVPKFLGQDGQRTYLVLATATSESRSSGGLGGSLGSMTTNNGSFQMGDFYPNTEFEGENSEVYTDSDKALFPFSFDIRDQEADPDFNNVAKNVATIWQQSSHSTNVDGVMAIDPVFIQELVKLNGNVQIPNGPLLTGDNTAQFLLNDIYKDVYTAYQDEYFQYVASNVMDATFKDLSINKLVSIAKLISPMAEGRHVSFVSFHEDENKAFSDMGLTNGIPSDEEKPEFGMYFNQLNASKMDWYLHRNTQITRTSCNQDGSQTYHVTVTLENALSYEDYVNGPTYILGGGDLRGHIVDKMLLYAPAGGSISNLTVGGSAQIDDPQQGDLNGNGMIYTVANIAYGQNATFDFDMTTSPKAKEDLKLDQTPMGWTVTGVDYGKAACEIKE